MLDDVIGPLWREMAWKENHRPRLPIWPDHRGLGERARDAEDRARRVWSMHEDGYSNTEISQAEGITPQRVRQILK